MHLCLFKFVLVNTSHFCDLIFFHVFTMNMFKQQLIITNNIKIVVEQHCHLLHHVNFFQFEVHFNPSSSFIPFRIVSAQVETSTTSIVSKLILATITSNVNSQHVQEINPFTWISRVIDSWNYQIKNLIARWESSWLEPLIFVIDTQEWRENHLQWWRPFNMITKCWSFQSTKLKFIKSEQT